MTSSHQSIFSYTLRAFCKSFALVAGFLTAVTICVIIIALFTDDLSTPDKGKIMVDADANGARKILADTTPVLLKININGVIGEGDFTAKKITEALLTSREGILKDRVKGILLYMNTPGGTANDADVIYRALLDYKERYHVPIFTYVEGFCASGGIYIAAASDRILASPESVIGSVGVILGPNFNVFETMQRVGVKALTLTEGKDKDMLNPFREWVPGEEASLKKITLGLYERFVDLVVAARPNLDREKLVQDYGAQVFMSQEAKEIGYIDDDNSSYSSALKELARASNIGENDKYQVLHIEPSHSIISEIAQGKTSFMTGKIKHVFPLGPNINSEMSGKFLYLYTPAK